MEIKTIKDNMLPKTFRGWIVFIALNASAFGVFGAGLKETYYFFSDIIKERTAAKRIEEENQVRLWNKNKECYKKTEPFKFKTENNENLSILICKDSGDFYVEVIPQNRDMIPVLRWIEIERIKKVAFFLSSELIAKEKTFLQRNINSEAGLLCRVVYEQYVVEIKQYEDGSCQRIVKWFNGKLEMQQGNCNTRCEK